MNEIQAQESPSILHNSETKLFKLTSSGNWNDQGTGRTSIFRYTNPVQSLEITFKLHPQPQPSQQDDKQVNEEQQNQAPVEEYLFESINSYSIQSNSILVFTCRQKRFALSFKDSDTKFLQFFSDLLKSPEEQMMQELNAGSITDYMSRDDNFIQTLKTSFQKAERQEDLNTIVNLADIFKKLLVDCNQTFIKATFTDDNIQFLLSVLEYGSQQKQAQFREYFKKIKYQNILSLPPHIEKAAKFMIYLTEFKDMAPLMIEPKFQNYIAFALYENSTIIVNYLVANQSIVIDFFDGFEENIRGRIKLISEMMLLLSNISVDNKTKLVNLLISSGKGNLFYRLTECLHDKQVMNSVKLEHPTGAEQNKQSLFEEIIKILIILSSSHPSEFQEFLFVTIKNKALPQHNLCSAIVFGYLNGNINIKSLTFQLLTNIFNPESSYKHHHEADQKGDSQESKQIYLLLDRKILTPICKQLFKVNTSYEGEQLILEWISRVFTSFPYIMRRVVIESGIIKKALSYSKKQKIILVVSMKILKSMLFIKDAYTIRYFKFSKVIEILQAAYLKNRGKINLISSLFRSIQADIQELKYEPKFQRELDKIFHIQENTVHDY